MLDSIVTASLISILDESSDVKVVPCILMPPATMSPVPLADSTNSEFVAVA